MRLSWLAVLVPVLLMSVGGTILAAAASDGVDASIISACARLNDGRLRAKSPAVSCRANERQLEWNVQGPAGPPGPPGPAGEPGHGLSSFDDLGGLACHAGGQDGTTSISYDATQRAVITCVVAGGTDAPAVKINEFSTGVSGAATNEFIELFNAGAIAADLGGVRIVYRSAGGTSETTLAKVPPATQLAPGAFYLLGGSGYSGAESADQSFGTALSSTGGSIGIRSSDGGLLDAVGYGTAANGLGEGQPAPAPPLTPSPGSSGIRLPDSADTDDNATDFRVTATPTPRGRNMTG
jgi:hypothetical protein